MVNRSPGLGFILLAGESRVCEFGEGKCYSSLLGGGNPAAGHCNIGRIYPQYKNNVKVRTFCSNCSMITDYEGTIGQAWIDHSYCPYFKVYIGPYNVSTLEAEWSGPWFLRDPNSQRWSVRWKATFSSHSCHLGYPWTLVLWKDSCATMGQKVLFKTLFKNIGEKLVFFRIVVFQPHFRQCSRIPPLASRTVYECSNIHFLHPVLSIPGGVPPHTASIPVLSSVCPIFLHIRVRTAKPAAHMPL